MLASTMFRTLLLMCVLPHATVSIPWLHSNEVQVNEELEMSKDGSYEPDGRRALKAKKLDLLVREGEAPATYRITKLEDENAATSPSEILIEVINAKPPKEKWYSVTIESQGRYSGTAHLAGEAPPHMLEMMKPLPLIYSWKPLFSGDYEVVVHEIPQHPVGNPKNPPLLQSCIDKDKDEDHILKKCEEEDTSLVVIHKPGLPVDPWEAVIQRMPTLPPCSTLQSMDLYTKFEGNWFGPHMRSPKDTRLRNGWFFLPSAEMNCKIETFSPYDLRYLTEEKSIYILGNSKERGIFLSLVDLLLNKDEKKDIEESVISKCWGRAFVKKHNLKVLYQDWRSDNFNTRSNQPTVVCHNEKVAREGGPLFYQSGMKVWNEIFEDPTQWPSVILMSTGNDFGFEGKFYDINQFINILPPEWQGTLFLTDGAFSARHAGRGYASDYEQYRAKLKELTSVTSDPRVRWFDGLGVSKEMRMYGEWGPDHTAFSQHFHGQCDEPYHDVKGRVESMRICSNVTENVAQLLIGHAVGPKDALLEKGNQLPNHVRAPNQAMYCHNCPEKLLPFHITPHPDMTCNVGALHPRTNHEIKSKPQICPKECMDIKVSKVTGSQSDQIHERDCPIEFFPMGFMVGNEMPVEMQRALGEADASLWFMDVWCYSTTIIFTMLVYRQFRIRSLFR